MTIKLLGQKIVRISSSSHSESRPHPSSVERAEYMVDMIMQLKDMAVSGDLHVLSGILEVAYQEARAQARRA